MSNRFFSFLLAGALVCALAACRHHEEHEHHHDAVHYTAYGDHYEVYVEAEPFVVNQEASLLVHLTRLYDFKPVDGAVISVLLDGKAIDAHAHAEETLGLYHIAFTPVSAGHTHLTLVVSHPNATDTVTFHVDVFASHEEMHHHEGHHHHDRESDADGITFTKEQSWQVDFRTDVVRPQPFAAVIRTTAQILPAQGDEQVLTAKASGVVMLSQPHWVEGASVSAGQRVCVIESGDMADNNMVVRLRQASAAYEEASATYERQQKLAEDHIVSQTELDRSRMRYEESKALYESLSRNSYGHGTQVVAPMSGFIREIHVRNGSYVEAGQPLMVITKNRDLMVRAEVPPRYYPQLQHIISAHFVLGDSVYTLSDLQGTLVGYGHSTEVSSTLIPVTFRVRNSAGWVPGTFLTTYILTASDREVLAVPNTGIVEEMGNHFIFVQQTPERFERRLVTLGATDGLQTVVESGLHSGERVVTCGAALVKMAQATATLDPHAGHVHSH